ncbi:mandelate racemase/muconate lactonizing enzyme family protein [Pararhizobium sp. YC-54]|uniref:mandelate racemase/muconate lactonizing enzyme family protein n=1 Tax=Pararhizobium sp. YC-54 TaxID=2986920 RepID=UPI0021F6D30E|nr:mandelate racemase/muconate lactonizing enzyme family protein [Pararhizobium sp. YC-54]MCW0001758.1 mandelate racemase/muconate lactonizing enzyme family protein [Pararhizobium sp. YC-54]
MKIKRISLFSIPIDVGMELTRYVSSQEINPALDVLVVKIESDSGLVGWGEVCSAPPYYLPELSAGAREGIRHVASIVLGRDPRQIAPILKNISAALRGHGNAKTALEMALWDLAAKCHGIPLVDLWGGRVAESLPVLNVVRIGTREETLAQFEAQRALGYSRFQIKVGAGEAHDDITTIRMVEEIAQPHERLWYDPNRAWLVDDAIRIITSLRDLNPLIENPCDTYEECRTVAQRTGARIMLDEVLDSPQRFVQAVHDQVLDVASLKTSAIGGIEAARNAMRLAEILGVPVRIEDYYGTGILLACVTHMGHTLPKSLVYGLYDYVSDDLPLVNNPLKVINGEIRLPDKCCPGLGVDVNESILGNPVAVLEL